MGGVDKLRIKLYQLSTKVELEVEAELGNYSEYSVSSMTSAKEG